MCVSRSFPKGFYFRNKHLERLVRHQIESYNHFINCQIQRTIAMFNPVTIHSENDFVEKYDKYDKQLLADMIQRHSDPMVGEQYAAMLRDSFSKDIINQ